ncbi:MAG: HIT domain-containing protein [Acidimicrobiales bacterium]
MATPTNDPDCPFCVIIAGEDPEARVIFRTDSVVAFFPTEPATLGHTLLVPRRHIPDIWALDATAGAQLAAAAVGLAGAIRRSIEPDGLNLIQSNGEAATQTVMHLHIHLVPRWENDAIGRIWPKETNYSEGAKDRAWDRLRRECESI